MNVNNYVNKIVRKIKCSSARRKEIRKQLQMDIELRMQQGESLEQVMFQMGDIREIADSFKYLSRREEKVYAQKDFNNRCCGSCVSSVDCDRDIQSAA